MSHLASKIVYIVFFFSFVMHRAQHESRLPQLALDIEEDIMGRVHVSNVLDRVVEMCIQDQVVCLRGILDTNLFCNSVFAVIRQLRLVVRDGRLDKATALQLVEWRQKEAYIYEFDGGAHATARDAFRAEIDAIISCAVSDTENCASRARIGRCGDRIAS